MAVNKKKIVGLSRCRCKCCTHSLSESIITGTPLQICRRNLTLGNSCIYTVVPAQTAVHPIRNSITIGIASVGAEHYETVNRNFPPSQGVVDEHTNGITSSRKPRCEDLRMAS